MLTISECFVFLTKNVIYQGSLNCQTGMLKFALYIVSFYVLFVFNRLGMTASQTVNTFWHN